MLPSVHHAHCPLCSHPTLTPLFMCRDHTVSQEEFLVVQCENCTFRFTQEVPDSEHIGAYYKAESYISHSDTREGFMNQLYHRARAYMLGQKHKLLRKHSPGKRLLDVGCGTGYFLQFMQGKGWDVLGIEPDEDARNFAKNNFNLTVFSPEVLSAWRKEKKASFEAITLWHVLEHLHRPDHYLQSLRDMLTDDGVLLVAVPNYASGDGAHYAKDWAAYDVPRHLWHFSPETLERLAKGCGFAVKAKLPMPLDAFYVSMLSEEQRGKGKLTALLKGAFVGGQSFLGHQLKTRRGSSLIYLLRKTSPESAISEKFDFKE